MLNETNEIWTQDLLVLRPRSAGDLIGGVIAAIWHTKLIQILPDCMPSLHARDLDDLYASLATEIFCHLSGEASSRSWGTHPREKWIDVVSKSAAAGKDRPRDLHTDEAGLADPADIALMYCVQAADAGGGNNFVSADQIWRKLKSAHPALAEQLLSYPVPYRAGGRIVRQPILRHRQGRTLINFNSKLVHAGHDAAADALAAAFSGFLRNNIDRGDMIEVTLAAGGAMIWWDELFLHGRRPVDAGAEKRTYRKAGIVIRPSPIRRFDTNRGCGVGAAPAAAGRPAAAAEEDLSQDERILPVIEAEIARRRRQSRAFVVGISGMNGAGKSTLARKIGAAAARRGSFDNIVTVSIDDFHWPKERRYLDDFAGRAFLEGYFDRERLINRILRPLHERGCLQTALTLLDEKKDEYVDVRRIAIGRRDLLIVEGVFLFRDDILPYLDLTVLLNVPIWFSMQRVINRRVGRAGAMSTLAKFLDRYLPANMRHTNLDRPCEHADLIFDMTNREAPLRLAGHSPDWPIWAGQNRL